MFSGLRKPREAHTCPLCHKNLSIKLEHQFFNIWPDICIHHHLPVASDMQSQTPRRLYGKPRISTHTAIIGLRCLTAPVADNLMQRQSDQEQSSSLLNHINLNTSKFLDPRRMVMGQSLSLSNHQFLKCKWWYLLYRLIVKIKWDNASNARAARHMTGTHEW